MVLGKRHNPIHYYTVANTNYGYTVANTNYGYTVANTNHGYTAANSSSNANNFAAMKPALMVEDRNMIKININTAHAMPAWSRKRFVYFVIGRNGKPARRLYVCGTETGTQSYFPLHYTSECIA